MGRFSSTATNCNAVILVKKVKAGVFQGLDGDQTGRGSHDGPGQCHRVTCVHNDHQEE